MDDDATINLWFIEAVQQLPKVATAHPTAAELGGIVIKIKQFYDRQDLLHHYLAGGRMQVFSF